MVHPIKIYVGNVPPAARNSELKELFEKFGKVIECDILKEFAFVHMDDISDAKASIAGLNDSLWKGSRIRVEISTTRTSKGEPSLRKLNKLRAIRHRTDYIEGSGAERRYRSPESSRHPPRDERDRYASRSTSTRAAVSSRDTRYERSRPYSDSYEHRNGAPRSAPGAYPPEPYRQMSPRRTSSRRYDSADYPMPPPPPAHHRPSSYHDPYMRPPPPHYDYHRGPPPPPAHSSSNR